MNPTRVVMLVAWLLASPVAPAGELGDLLRATLEHPAVSATELEAAAARDNLQAERMRFAGAGSAFADGSRYEGERFVGVLTPSALAAPPFAREVRRHGASYGLPIDLAGAIRASRRAASHELAAAQLAQRQAALLKLSDTAVAYTELQALLRRQRVLAVQRERVAQTVERVALQVETEQSSTAELRLAQAEAGKLQSDEVRLAGAIERARAALEESSGRSLLPAAAAIRIPDWDPGEPESLLPAELAEERAFAAGAQAQAARRALWPGLALSGDYTEFSGSGYSSDHWSVMAQVVVPIDPAGWKRAAAARARARAAEESGLAARREARRDWAGLAAGYRSALADAAALRGEIAAREEVVRVQAELLRVGMASLEDFLRQQRDLLDAESRLGDAQAQAVASWAAMQVLAGAEVPGFIEALDPA
jgi:outer membrane protein TolC